MANLKSTRLQRRDNIEKSSLSMRDIIPVLSDLQQLNSIDENLQQQIDNLVAGGDVLEFANLASFPVTGETGKIYVAIDTGKTYRWSGSIYVEISQTDTPQATEVILGGGLVSTQAIIENTATTNDTSIVTPKKYWLGITKFLSLAWTWTLKQTFSAAPRFSSTTANQRLEVDGNKDLISVAKATADNKNFGSTAGTVTEGDKPVLIAGRAGGQTATGGVAAGEDLTLASTANATKGKIKLGTSAYDEVNNRLGLGTQSPLSRFHTVIEAIADRFLFIDGHFNNTAPITFSFRKSRGTAAAPTALTIGDNVGLFPFLGHDGTAYRQTASMRVLVDGAVSAGVVPLAFVFETGTTEFPVERFRLGSDGKFTSPTWKETQVLQNQAANTTSTSGEVIVSGTFTSGGGKLVIHVSGTLFKPSSGLGTIGLQIENTPGGGVWTTYANKSHFTNTPVINTHMAFGGIHLVTSAIAAGTNRGIRVVNLGTVNTDFNDFYDITVLELPH